MAMGAAASLATQALGSAAKSKEQRASFTPQTPADFQQSAPSSQPHPSTIMSQMMQQPPNPYADNAAGMAIQPIGGRNNPQQPQQVQADPFRDLLKKMFGGGQ